MTYVHTLLFQHSSRLVGDMLLFLMIASKRSSHLRLLQKVKAKKTGVVVYLEHVHMYYTAVQVWKMYQNKLYSSVNLYLYSS